MKNNKNLLIVVVALGLGAAIFFLAKGKGKGNEGGGNGGELPPPPPPPSPQDELRWRKMSNEFFEAFNGCGTTDNVVKGLINKITSESDWQGVIRAYGTKTTTSAWWCIGNSDFTGGLLDTLNDECNTGEIDEYNTLLSSKGVTTLIPN